VILAKYQIRKYAAVLHDNSQYNDKFIKCQIMVPGDANEKWIGALTLKGEGDDLGVTEFVGSHSGLWC